MCVAQDHLDVAVPEQLSNRVQVDAGLHKFRCEVVPAIMKPEVSDLGRADERRPRLLDVLERSIRIEG